MGVRGHLDDDSGKTIRDAISGLGAGDCDCFGGFEEEWI